VEQPHCAYRLRDGRVFIVGKRELVVLDRDRQGARRLLRPAGEMVRSARMFDDGTFALLTTTNGFTARLLRLDAAGEETAGVNLGRFGSLPWSSYHFSPDGGLVMPDQMGTVVKCFDKDGKLKWATAVASAPDSVTALPGAGYLVTHRLTGDTTELDGDGKVVKTAKVPEGRPQFFDRR
jgi:hypothetical protein